MQGIAIERYYMYNSNRKLINYTFYITRSLEPEAMSTECLTLSRNMFGLVYSLKYNYIISSKHPQCVPDVASLGLLVI